MALRVQVARGAGHPWFGEKRPGFDHLFIEGDSETERDAAVARAERKFWRPWILGTNGATGKPGGVLYKPSGATAPWHDSPKYPHPGALDTKEPCS